MSSVRVRLVVHSAHYLYYNMSEKHTLQKENVIFM